MKDEKELMEEDFKFDALEGVVCVLWTYAVVGLVVVALIALTGCTTTRYVPVPEVHTEYIHTVDSVHHTDSVFREKETIVMQLDSAAMAQYGIQLKNAEYGWLVKTKELERELQRIAEMKNDTIIKTDSISVPYPVERKLTRWEKVKMDYGAFALGGTLIAVVLVILQILRWIRKRDK